MNRRDRSLGERTALLILRWYPRGWRDRYGYEMGQMLSTHRVTVATLIDLLVAALDAHLHRLPPSTPTGSRRLLGAQVRLFGVWLLFGLATMALLRVRDRCRSGERPPRPGLCYGPSWMPSNSPR